MSSGREGGREGGREVKQQLAIALKSRVGSRAKESVNCVYYPTNACDYLHTHFTKSGYTCLYVGLIVVQCILQSVQQP